MQWDADATSRKFTSAKFLSEWLRYALAKVPDAGRGKAQIIRDTHIGSHVERYVE